MQTSNTQSLMRRTIESASPGTKLQRAQVNQGTDPGRLTAPRAPGEPIRVMLLVSSLERGGAERQVVLLANHLDRRRFEVTVCSLSPEVPLAVDLIDRDRVLTVVAKRWRYDLGAVTRVAGLMRRLRTQMVHAFLFDAEMVARLAAKLAGVPIVVSSERNSNYVRPVIHSLCLRLTSPWSAAMIANSHAGKRFTVRTLGVPADRIHVVHNGVDTDRFRPRESHRLRSALGIAPDHPLVGMVASFKPQKNHLMFLRMAGRVLERIPETRFVCVGERLCAGEGAIGATGSGARVHAQSAEYHRTIASALDGLALGDRVMMPGKWDDMPDFYNACDLTVLTSRHEGTPNVLLESMACGVPVVATEVSDNADILPEGCGGFLVQLDDDEG
ncbi:MAG: glycosyltransferase, partial [Planctomycetes bacterium]|nr:glycosyltransferase [Planctomycetota bacterium]